ncbi:ABC transporter substrate-binding protein [Sandarakinorhabdus sp. DWP1-3-1]|uniref:ABC transporter substrate-binding protein n=1 Tax=Sandarakinorhabdus sp. DWP1-3-1 TaxID=2804627 RepID=UPI003CE6FB12
MTGLRSPTIAAVPAMVLLAMAGCGPDRPEGARLTVTVVGGGDRPGGVARRLVAEATQPTLVARDGNGDTVAGLATSWRFVDDGRSLILRLRPVKWSDGKPLVADDVVAAFRRAAGRREAATIDAGIANAGAIASRALPAARLGVLAPIARVVEIRLDAPSPLLLGWLAEPALGVVRAASPRKSATPPPTLAAYAASGPPELRVLKRFAMAASPDARPAEISIAVSSDARAAVADFVAGRQDIVIGEGLAGLGEARVGARADALRLDPLWGVYGYLVNSRSGPTADAGVRRALAMAIDRPALAGSFGLATIQPATGLVPSPAGATPDWLRLDYDGRLLAARQLLAAAGWTAERPLRLVLLLPPGRDHRAVAERVGADWARINVLLAVTDVEAEPYDKLVARGDFDLAVREASLPVPDAAALLSRFRCGAGPHCNPAADALLAAARAAAPGDRARLLAEAEAALLAAPPLIPLFTPVRWALVSRRVDGWLPNSAGSHPLARLAAR